MTTSREGAPSLNYIRGFDGLRGIAVLAVMMHHFGVPGFAGGFVGVDVFFLLSGFLITRILQSRFERENRVPFADFYSRRARRILPAFWTMLAVMALVVTIDPGYVSPANFFHSAGISIVFMTQWQIMMDDLPGPLVHLWSLGWEENFYLVWPLLFAFAGRRGTWRAFRSIIATVVFGFALMRILVFWCGLSPWRWLWAFGYFRVDAIILGCALALFTTPSPPSTKRRPWSEAAALGALVLLVAVFSVRDENFFWAGGFTLVSAATLAIANHLRRREPSAVASLLELSPLRWTGLISYGLYLWHFPVHWWVKERGLSKPMTVVISFAASYAIAAASYYTLEAFFRGLPRRNASNAPRASV